MNKQVLTGLIKHGDFIALDVICLQLCYLASYWTNVEFASPYHIYGYRYQALVMLASQILVILFSNNYHGIIRRPWFDELGSVFTYIVEVFVIALVYLFAVHWAGEASRLQFGITCLYFMMLDFLLRQAYKWFLRKRAIADNKRHSLVIVTSRALLGDVLQQLSNAKAYQGFFVSNIVLMDEAAPGEETIEGIPVVSLDQDATAAITHTWVDEVFILQPDDKPFPSDFVDDLMEMGITVSFSLSGTRFSVTDTGKVGPYAVLTSRIREVSIGQVMVKRLFDIVGGFVGSVLTLVIFVFVAPMIYYKSPGPIFFVQKRVGRNGKPFNMYKFRSMYLDAEERKASLEAQNRVDNGLMFKMDDDPRIIGSEKRGKNGEPRGIGNFIRRYSIDEFPQFFNVLRGEMSLVGTRPPTMDEWERYSLEHRVRMAIKPGITGLWQVSGRSKITDFDQVVRLDREYIEQWNLGMDVKILLKTVMVVIGARGAL